MSLGSHELELMFSALTTIAGFFIALWIKGVRDDVRSAVIEINSIGNRITKLETQVAMLSSEVDGLRRERHELADKIQSLLYRKGTG